MAQGGTDPLAALARGVDAARLAAWGYVVKPVTTDMATADTDLGGCQVFVADWHCGDTNDVPQTRYTPEAVAQLVRQGVELGLADDLANEIVHVRFDGLHVALAREREELAREIRAAPRARSRPTPSFPPASPACARG